MLIVSVLGIDESFIDFINIYSNTLSTNPMTFYARYY